MKRQGTTEVGIRGDEYNKFWTDAKRTPRQVSRRSSLVIDPPDGRIPPITLDAVKRLEAREAARRGRGEADTWEDRNLGERCLTALRERGVHERYRLRRLGIMRKQPQGGFVLIEAQAGHEPEETRSGTPALA